MNVFLLFKSKQMRAALTVFVCTLFIAGVLYGVGWYPVLSVNGSVIWARGERISYRLAQNFYRTMEEQAHVRSPRDDELTKAAYDGLVDDVLISEELRTMLSDEEVREKVSIRVGEILGGPQGLKQAMEWTRMSEKNTRTYFLEPLARQQLLTELLMVKKQQYAAEWLLIARKDAHVRVWFTHGEWKGEGGYENK